MTLAGYSAVVPAERSESRDPCFIAFGGPMVPGSRASALGRDDSGGCGKSMAGHWARPSHVVWSSEPSVERLDLHDRRTVVAAGPEHRPRSGLLDEGAADVGRTRQLVLGDLPGLDVEAGDQIVQHRAGPDLG